MIVLSEPLTDLSKLSNSGKNLVILRHKIFEHWEVIVREEILAARDIKHPILIDTLPAFLENLAQSLTPAPSDKIKSDFTTIAQEHGGERARITDYGVENIVREYQVLRSSIFEVFNQEDVALNFTETKFIHSFIDKAIQEAVIGYALVQADMREKFMASLSHDLRTPLNSAQMAAQLIVRKSPHPEVLTLAQKIIESNKRIDRMIQNLLDVTMLKTGMALQLDISQFDMLEVVKECIAQAETAHGERFKLIGESVLGYWGVDAIKRALDNLIENAVKYGDPHKHIELRIHSEHERVFIAVHNNGYPIPLNEQEAIFQIFRRSAATAKSHSKGWGIGLSLVRGVAEGHGGSVTLQSRLEVGTTFTIDIPVDSRPFQLKNS